MSACPLLQAIREGKNFYQYAESINLVEREQPRFYMLTKLAFEAKELDYNRPRQSSKQYIVLTPNGHNKEKDKFTLHSHLQDAAEYGIKFFGFKKYTIQVFSQYKLTADYQLSLQRQASYKKWNERKQKYAPSKGRSEINSNNLQSILSKPTRPKGEAVRLYRLKLKDKLEKTLQKNFPKRSNL